MNKTITTSWDDGHPLDFRIAELLDKYGMKGTFYIPKSNPQNGVMSENEVKLLSNKFEIGGHTLNHVNLKKLDAIDLNAEIEGSYHWLKNTTGKNPVAFCPPFGAYNDSVLASVKRAGFTHVRSTQLLACHSKDLVAHTTLQMYQHSSFTYAKHLLKRARINDLLFWLASGSTSDLLKLADYYLNHIDENGGCFHLWGHSWEIEKFNLWKPLEALLQHLANRNGYTYIENGELKSTY